LLLQPLLHTDMTPVQSVRGQSALQRSGSSCCGRQGRWIGAADDPVDLKRRVRYYPNGPLADSYHRGRKGKYLRCRYDSIRVSPGIRVTDVRYLYEDAVRAGSDHALVVADIDLP
jgi:endonuclease/exonuclease/phosphatase family metal-dependent hydrolase